MTTGLTTAGLVQEMRGIADRAAEALDDLAERADAVGEVDLRDDINNSTIVYDLGWLADQAEERI